MSIWRRNYYEENIDTTYQTTILALLNEGMLPVLNFIRCLKADKPEIVQEVTETLQRKLLELIPEQIESSISAELGEAFPDLKDYPMLL